jgi:hypothetical protein
MFFETNLISQILRRQGHTVRNSFPRLRVRCTCAHGVSLSRLPISIVFSSHLPSFGRLKDKKSESEISLALSPPVVLPLNIIKKSSAAVPISPTVLPPSPTSSFLGQPLPQMLDTLRQKKSVAAVVTTSLVARSRSESFHRYLRADGKEIAIHALSDEHYREMPETPLRCQKHFKNITPSSAKDISSLLASNYDESKRMADSLQEYAPLAAKDIFGLEEYPRVTSIPIFFAEDFIVIDPALSHVFNLPHCTSSMRRVVNKAKSLSRVGPNKENIPSSSAAKYSRVSACPFSHSELFSRTGDARAVTNTAT